MKINDGIKHVTDEFRFTHLSFRDIMHLFQTCDKMENQNVVQCQL